MLLHCYKLKLQGFYNYIIFSDIFCLKNVYNWKMISKFVENSVKGKKPQTKKNEEISHCYVVASL